MPEGFTIANFRHVAKGLQPGQFDYEGDKVLVNTASHRNKCEWIRNSPCLTMLLGG
jgi:hypothetical protein